MHELLSNLTMTNEQFISFLNKRVYNYIITFAAQGLNREIDTSFPVLDHLKPAFSFLKFDCFFATYEASSAMTAYNILSFPHKLVDEQFHTIEVPEYITVSPNTFSFAFEGRHSKVLSDCLDNIVSSSIASACQTTNFNKNAVLVILSLMSLFYLKMLKNFTPSRCIWTFSHILPSLSCSLLYNPYIASVFFFNF